MGVFDDGGTLRRDLLIRRGASFRRGIRRMARTSVGGDLVPLDMSGWDGLFLLAGPMGDVWLRRHLLLDAEGWAVVDLEPAAFMDGVWAGRRTGVWHMTAADPSGDVARIGEGYWTLA